MANQTLLYIGYFIIFFSVFIINLLGANMLSVAGVGFEQSAMNYQTLNATQEMTSAMSSIPSVIPILVIILMGLIGIGLLCTFRGYG